ncbi:MAG: PadR family transcriptional regulator [Muricomes sp.]
MPESFERGALTEAVFYILLSVHTPMHGYAIMQSINDLTNSRVNLGAGTLYGALNTLSDKKWIAIHGECNSGRKKEYVITELGKNVFTAELERLNELLDNAKKVLEEINYD